MAAENVEQAAKKQADAKANKRADADEAKAGKQAERQASAATKADDKKAEVVDDYLSFAKRHC